jgi:hypothetical protein
VATSYRVTDAGGDYEGHTYVTSFALPGRVSVTGGEIVAAASAKWPDLLLGVFRVSLVDTAAGRAYPLRREWVSVERAAPAPSAEGRARAAAQTASGGSVKGSDVKDGGGAKVDGGPGAKVEGGVGAKEEGGVARWRLLARTAQADVYENARALPRAWLASEARALDGEAALGVIRTGRLPGGESWEPLRTALVEPGAKVSPEPVASASAAGGPVASMSAAGGAAGRKAEVSVYEPNRVDVRTKADAPSILVLGENHYPGWHAYLDGEPAVQLRVNYALRGVAVPAGEHEVSFRYRPGSLLAGLAVTLLTLAGLLLWWRRLLPEAMLHGLAARLPRPLKRGGNDE